ncbi:hypothetical protein [Sphingomonas montana]|uniref:hypothetical protein n=1 Tax=Sphingomonas montana TaxID=1843236 RepID=UPI00096C6321|nr:hypothetical protein [Sphingomonas montana]
MGVWPTRGTTAHDRRLRSIVNARTGGAHQKDRIPNMTWDMTRDAEVYSTAAIEGATPEERLFAGSLEDAVTYIRSTRPSDQALLAIRLVPDDKAEGPIYGARIPELFPMQ